MNILFNHIDKELCYKEGAVKYGLHKLTEKRFSSKFSTGDQRINWSYEQFYKDYNNLNLPIILNKTFKNCNWKKGIPLSDFIIFYHYIGLREESDNMKSLVKEVTTTEKKGSKSYEKFTAYIHNYIIYSLAQSAIDFVNGIVKCNQQGKCCS